MNVKIDVDITPEEVRRLMGLPDISGFQEDLMARIRQQMDAGAEGYDPLSLMQPYMQNAFSSMEAFQRMMGGVMNMANSKSKE